MKKIILLTSIIIVFLPSALFSQSSELSDLKMIKEELTLQKKAITDSIKAIDTRIAYLKSKDQDIVPEGKNYIAAKVRIEAKIKNKPDALGVVLGFVGEGQTVKLYEYFGNGYWSVTCDSISGYTNDMYINKNKDMRIVIEDYIYEKHIKKYGVGIAYKIRFHLLEIGMIPEIVRLSIGRPDDINKSTGSYGVHEQWVYEDKDMYLYFENGTLTSWQE